MQQAREEVAELRAERLAAKLQSEKDHKERLAEARRLLVEFIVDSGESQDFADAVVQQLGKDRKLLETYAGNEVNAAHVQEFGLKVKRNLFHQKLMMRFHIWTLTERQRSEIVDWVLQERSSSELSSLVAQENLGPSFWKEPLKAVQKKSENFTCPVCMDPLVHVSPQGSVDTSNMWFASLRKNEHWSNQPCGHACCRTCMKMWAETAINDQKTRIKCPAVGCSYSLWDHEVQALVREHTFERYLEHKNTDYLKHLKSTMKADPSLTQWLKGHARPCPECHVLMSRYEGCNHMVCVCGTHFCYACGFKTCKCGKSNKKDIWKPKAQHRRELEAGA